MPPKEDAAADEAALGSAANGLGDSGWPASHGKSGTGAVARLRDAAAGLEAAERRRRRGGGALTAGRWWPPGLELALREFHLPTSAALCK